MATVTIRDLPDDIHGKLKERASRNRRSLNAELIACLEALFKPRPVDVQAELAELRKLQEGMEIYTNIDEIQAFIDEGRE